MAVLKLLSLVSLSALVMSLASRDPQTTFDPIYDDGSAQTDTLDCSGTILAKNPAWTEFQKIPNFPNIGGGSVVTGFDSAGCGTCWALTYNDITVNVLVVDFAADGFNVAESTFSILTDGQTGLGVIDVNATEVAASVCGF